MTPLPATKIDEIREKISRAIDVGSIPCEFELAALKRDIFTVKKQDIAMGWDMEAVLAGLQGDFETMIRNHELALEYNPRAYWIYYHYGVGVFAMKSYTKALELAVRSLELGGSESKEVWSLAIKLMILLEREDLLERHVPEYEKLFGTLDLDTCRVLTVASEVVSQSEPMDDEWWNSLCDFVDEMEAE